MYVKRIVLEKIKGFRSLDFTFTRPGGKYAGWTVLTGENAAGKTALLKAIALALVGPDVARVLQPSLRGWVRDGEDEGAIAVEVVPGSEDRFVKGGRRVADSFWCELELGRLANDEAGLKAGRTRRGKKKGPLNGPWAEKATGWFCAGYGPFRRLYGASPDAQRLMSGPGHIARFATMFREDATLGECEIWLKNLSHKKLEKKPREEKILSDVLLLLNSEFLRNGMQVERVDSDGLWLRDPRGVELLLSDMSEGYRAALALLIDLVRQLIDVYGDEGLIEHGNDGFFVTSKGVVLIDEVDSHLHPEWQRQIGFWLKKYFPGVQFIVTTHSALICQAADERGLFHLPKPGSDRKPFRLDDSEYRRVLRSKPDAILIGPAFDLSHTRSPRAVRARQEYAALRAKRGQGFSLTRKERNRENQLLLFVDEDED